MATLSGDLELHPIGGDARTVAEQLKLFHLLVVVIDPYTYESSWLLETAGRVLENFSGADCRVGWLVTAPEDDTKAFLGPWAQRAVTFCDPERTIVTALGLEQIPALVHVGHDLTVLGLAQGWNPSEWAEVCNHLATMMSWSSPVLPRTGDPVPFPGSPALG